LIRLQAAVFAIMPSPGSKLNPIDAFDGPFLACFMTNL